MTITVLNDAIALIGKCGAEDADDLLAAIVANPAVLVDISEADAIHTALWQILVAGSVQLRGEPRQAFVAATLLPALGWSPPGPLGTRQRTSLVAG